MTKGMFLKKGRMWFTGLTILVLILSILTGTKSPPIDELSQLDLAHKSCYEPHEEIIIECDDDFVFQGWLGNGTAQNPYIISGFEIATTGIGIKVNSTSVHFIIQDCLIYSSGGLYVGAGVEFHNLQNGRIINCRFENINGGVFFTYSGNCIVDNCQILNTNIPMHLYQSDNCIIGNSTIEGMLSLYDSDSCIIRSNTQFNKPSDYETLGINMIWCDDCLLDNNTVTNNDYGIWLDSGRNCVLWNNTLNNNGFLVRGEEPAYFRFEAVNNSVNGLPLGYFYGLGEVLINGSSFGQIIMADCNGATIQNGRVLNSTMGFLLAFCDSCTITNISSSFNIYGVTFDACYECAIMNSTVYGNDIGIYLLDISNGIEISRNYVTRNDRVGILFEAAMNCRVTENVITENLETGLSVTGSGHTVYWNTFGNNGQNAYDSGFANKWDDEFECGNYWDDMVTGAVYLVPGSANSVDHFPNGTIGTYTITPTTTGVPWIGNETDITLPEPTLLVTVAAGAGMVIIIAMVVYRRTGK